MEPIRYFDATDFMEPKCNECNHIIHYDRDAIFDKNKQALICRFCGTPL